MQDSHSPSGHLLDKTWQRGTLIFRYPGYWEIDEFSSEEELTVTVSTDETAFWVVSFYPQADDTNELLDSALETFQEEYEELDIYERSEKTSPGWIRQELEMHYQDLISTVVLQAKAVESGILFVMYQGHDRELIEVRPTFDAMTATVQAS